MEKTSFFLLIIQYVIQLFSTKKIAFKNYIIDAQI